MGGVTTVTEMSWRGRNDDGDEDGATWITTADTAWTQRTGQTFRWRANLAAGAAGSGATLGCQAQYQLNGGSWTNITTSSSVVKGVTSSFVADGTTCTEQMAGAQDYDPGNGGTVSADGLAATFTFGPSRDVEIEFILQLVGADLVTGDEINLRTTKAGVAMDAYGVALDPMITVDDPVGLDMLPLLGVS